LSIEAEPHTALPPRSFQALPMQAPQGWFAYLVPLVPLPLSLRVRSSYHEVLQALVRQLRADKNRSVFLELEELHKDNGIWQISRNASLWSPEMGLGVRVGHPSPRFWSWKLLSERALDDPFPPLMLSVMRLDAEESGCIHAVETMCGTGGLLQVLHSVPARQLLDAWMEALLPPIEEEGLRAFPVYVPLLSGEMLRGCTAEQLATWLGPSDAYLRESPQDMGLILLARRPLERELELAGIDVAILPVRGT
jgi:hypothetical protein